jgi:hypothetical protein
MVLPQQSYSQTFIIERDAMGDDEYHPISRKGSNLTEAGGIGYTVVDSVSQRCFFNYYFPNAALD